MTEENNSAKTVYRRVVIPEEAKKKYLVGNTPPFLGKTFELTPGAAFTIGREEGKSLQLPSSMVSRSHAKVELQDGRCILTDTNSSNGTFANGEKLPPNEPYLLSHRDVIKFDTYEFIFVDTAVGDIWQTLKPLSREGSQIVSFYSPKGGTGITTIVVNLAHYLATKAEKKVIVVDLDLRFGDVLTFLKGKPGQTIIEAIGETEVTPENIQKFIHKGSDFDYLAAPKKTELAELINPNHIKSILWSLEANYDFVLVDLQAVIDDITINTWELSNLIYLVGQPEIGHLIAARRVIEIMNQFKYPDSKFKLIMNKVGQTGSISAEEIKAFLKKEIQTLPYAPDDAILTSNGGEMLIAEKPSSPLSVGISNLARSMIGEEMIVQEDGGIFAKLKSLLGM